jgi:DNA replication protein DnaC
MFCDIHGEYESKELKLFDKVIKSGCPLCEEQYEKDELKKKEELEKYWNAKEKNELLKEQNIEPMFQDSTFENFNTKTKDQEYNRDTVKRLVSGEIQKIVMTGSNGTGKTHLASAAVKTMDGKIMTMYEISTKIRASYTNLAKETELDIVDNLARVPLLVIDEIGRTKGSDTETNWLSYIIDKRASRYLPVIIITNKHVRKVCEKGGCSDCLENYISEDIMSRLVENGVLLKFNGEDWRRKKIDKTKEV